MTRFEQSGRLFPMVPNLACLSRMKRVVTLNLLVTLHLQELLFKFRPPYSKYNAKGT